MLLFNHFLDKLDCSVMFAYRLCEKMEMSAKYIIWPHARTHAHKHACIISAFFLRVAPGLDGSSKKDPFEIIVIVIHSWMHFLSPNKPSCHPSRSVRQLNRTLAVPHLVWMNLTTTTTSTLLLHPFNSPLSGKGKTSLDLLEQEIVNGSGINWTICKSAPCPDRSSIPPLRFLQARCPSCRPTSSVNAWGSQVLRRTLYGYGSINLAVHMENFRMNAAMVVM